MKKLLPLHQAIVKRDHQQVRQLLDAGADIQALTANGRNALQLAEFAHNLPAMVMLEGSVALNRASDDIWCSALRQGDYRFADIPVERLSSSLCDTALLSEPEVFEALPAEYRQLETLIERCRLNPALIARLPAEIRQQSTFYQPLLQGDFLSRIALQHWPRPWLDEFIDKALAADPAYYCELPESDKTYSRSLAYVKAHGNQLLLVPESIKDTALCLVAMQTGYCLDAVPSACLGQDMIRAALATLTAEMQRWRHRGGEVGWLPRVSCKTLALLPEALRSYDICLAAVATDYHALALVPDVLKTLELCCAALEGRELLGMQLNDIFAMIPESLHGQVHQQARFTHHIQPGELELGQSGTAEEWGSTGGDWWDDFPQKT